MKAFLMAMLASLILPPATTMSVASRSLTIAEMDGVVGGLGIDITSPGNNFQSRFDNPVVKFDVDNSVFDTSTITVQFNRGTTKYGGMEVATPAPAYAAVTGNRLRSWPLDTAGGTLNIHYCSPSTGNCDLDPGGDNSRTGFGISPDVKVVKVKFHDLHDSTSATGVGSGIVQNLMDYPGFEDYNWQTTSASDAITAQCAGNQTVQFRFASWQNDLVPEGCTEPWADESSTTDPPFTSCPNWMDVFDGLRTDDGYFHVIFVTAYHRWVTGGGCGQDAMGNDISCWWNSGGKFPGGARNWVFVRTIDSTNYKSRVIAHEWGHSVGLPHSGDDCGDSYQTRNLMCGSSGRELVPAQCTTMYAGVCDGVSCRYDDFN